ncbi:hypothetical protein [Rhizobium azibense]|nr:hypothetical protein [Rhizobium azibense]
MMPKTGDIRLRDRSPAAGPLKYLQIDRSGRQAVMIGICSPLPRDLPANQEGNVGNLECADLLGWNNNNNRRSVMKLTSLTLIAVCMAALTSHPSFADCVDITGSTKTEERSGIAKDGAHAPMEGSQTTQAQANAAGANAPQKEGGTLPLAKNPNLATSEQDMVAQQHGEKTAAAKARKEKCD